MVLLLLREASTDSLPYRQSHFLPQTYQDKYTLSTLPRTPLAVHPSENISNEQTIRFEPVAAPSRHIFPSPFVPPHSSREEVAAFDNQSQFRHDIFVTRLRAFIETLHVPFQFHVYPNTLIRVVMYVV